MVPYGIFSRRKCTNSNSPRCEFILLIIEAGKEIHFPVKEGRQLYLVQIEGSSVINGENLVMRDAAEAVEEDIHIEAKSNLII